MKLEFNILKNYIEELAPPHFAEDWDNSGFLVGRENKIIEKILVTLDVTEETIDEAIKTGASLIIAHHPIIFFPIKSITDQDFLGRKLLKLIENNISVYAAHTNLDIAEGGTNDCLFELLELTEKEGFIKIAKNTKNTKIDNDENQSLGRIGKLKNPMKLSAYAELVRKKLGLKAISYSGNAEAIIEKIALCTGASSGEKYFKEALLNNCQLYLTSDIKHHEALDAKEMGLALIDGTHFKTENLIADKLVQTLNAFFDENNYDAVAASAKASDEVFKYSI